MHPSIDECIHRSIHFRRSSIWRAILSQGPLYGRIRGSETTQHVSPSAEAIFFEHRQQSIEQGFPSIASFFGSRDEVFVPNTKNLSNPTKICSPPPESEVSRSLRGDLREDERVRAAPSDEAPALSRPQQGSPARKALNHLTFERLLKELSVSSLDALYSRAVSSTQAHSLVPGSNSFGVLNTDSLFKAPTSSTCATLEHCMSEPLLYGNGAMQEDGRSNSRLKNERSGVRWHRSGGMVAGLWGRLLVA